MAATTSASSTVVDVDSIQRTVCEGRDLLFTTQAMDHLVRLERDIDERAIYLPLVLLVNIIGPHMVNGARVTGLGLRMNYYENLLQLTLVSDSSTGQVSL